MWPVGTRMPPLAAKESKSSFDIGEWPYKEITLTFGLSGGGAFCAEQEAHVSTKLIPSPGLDKKSDP